MASSIQSRLQSRNVTVDGHRTSLRLEQDVWDALEEVCLRENMNVHQLCTHIELRRVGSSRTAAVRAFVLSYFREAASDTGHVRAGHGAMSQGNGAKKSRLITELRSPH
ncbi:MAG TPA: ribbon-helix-helix domain-containing protein [Magnetovibrio sp.]